MSFDADDEILQDFLVEAGEILEALGEQLVELERNPDDKELLNAIFRGFHTVKGGAGFLQLEALVECCHVAENVFDHLRNGLLLVNSEVMDVVLQALDAVNEMFDQVKRGEAPQPADPALIEGLAALLHGGPSEAERAAELVEDPPAVSATSGKGQPGDEISDEEYETLLNALDSEQTAQHASASAEAPVGAKATSGDDITDDEFESLLDQLHGAGKFSADKAAASAKPASAANKSAKADISATKPQSVKASGNNDEITDDEFEALLDDLHGKGKFKAAPVAANSNPGPSAPDATTPASDNSDLITDDEFEKLLDELHGKGKSASGSTKPTAKAPAAKVAPAKAPAPTAAVEKPQPKTPCKTCPCCQACSRGPGRRW